jgi:hypothetical protein
MTKRDIHAAATPIKSRVYNITTFLNRDDWIRLLLAADSDEPSPGAKVVGARIALHHNVETGQCNPPIGTLVLGTGMSESTVRRVIRELEATGWIYVDRTRGRYANSYELRAPTLSNETGFNPVKGDSVEDSNPTISDWVQDDPTLPMVTPQPCQKQPNPVTADTHKRESITANITAKDIDSPRLPLGEEGLRRPNPNSQTETDANFEEFYRCYPKHAAKTAALKTYRTIMAKKLATAEDLLAGATRYAAERSGQDPKFTKHPSTWLNGGCWSDEPVRPIGNTIDNNGNPVPVRPPPDRQQQQRPAYGPQAAAALEAVRRLSKKGGHL